MEINGKFRKIRRSDNTPGDAHELTFSCFRRRAFLSKERTCVYLKEAIERAREKHNLHLWAYVFMPEHVHLLVWPEGPEYSTSAILLSIKQSVARRALRYLRQNNPKGLRVLATGQKHTPYRFWQDGGGYDRNVCSAKTLQTMVQYIHANPGRRGLVDCDEDWYWSSCREWKTPGAGPLSIDRESFPAV